MSLPINKNPFTSTAKWTSQLIDQVKINIDEIRETTSDFARKAVGADCVRGPPPGEWPP